MGEIRLLRCRWPLRLLGLLWVFGIQSACEPGLASLPSSVSLSPTAQDFGVVVVGQRAPTRTFIATGSGDESVGPIAARLEGHDVASFSIDGTDCSSPPHGGQADCVVTLAFSPASTGAKEASLVVEGPRGGTASASLIGEGASAAISPASLALTPSVQAFGTITLGGDSTRSFTVTNSGQAPSSLPTVAISGLSAGEFSIASNGCATAVSAGASCTLSIKFAPSSSGGKAATLSVSANPGGATTATLSGAGAAASGPGWPPVYTAPSEATVLSTLKPSHPRLVILEADLVRILDSVKADPVPASYLAALRRSGDSMLGEPVSQRVLVGPRLLAVSRTVLKRVYTLALLYRLTQEQKYLTRARAELLAVAAFSDWNPSHFLDVAEMTHAFGIGYDWLYSALSASDRATIKQAIVQKGLLAAKAEYEANAGWTKDRFNWNIVCNGGIAVGALAVADEEPTLARWLLFRNITNLPNALASYAPDGAWAEGPAYWEYATRYMVAMLASLRSALGTEFGLSSLPGLAGAGLFHVATLGPSGRRFNFADASDGLAGADPSMFWLGRRYDRPLYAYQERKYVGAQGTYGDLMWYDSRGTEADLTAVPTDVWFRGADVVQLLSSWTDGNAVWVGFKGGDNKANHSHLDLGTFVLEAQGQRWAIDLGADDYNLPGYWSREAQRYTYYRLGTRGQNTLLVGGVNQNIQAVAPITHFSRNATSAQTITDLTAAYSATGATKVRRGVALLAGRNRVLIRDELSTSAPLETVWTMHTNAAITLSGTTATLSQGGKQLQVKLLTPAGATFSSTEVTLNPPQNPISNVRRLQVTVAGVTPSAAITVLFLPQGAPSVTVTPRPLDEWPTSGPTQ